MTAPPPDTSAPAAIGPIAASAAIAALVLAFDLLWPGLDGLTVPLYTGAVLAAAVIAGASAALVVAVLCTVTFVWVYGSHTGDAALIGSAGLLMGAALIGRVIDRWRRRAGHLEQVVVALRREGRPAPDTEPEPAALAPRPAPQSAQPRRPSTGNLPRLLYRYARLLNVNDEDAIYTGLALTLEEVLPAQRVAVYALDDGRARLAAGDPLPAPPVGVAAGGATAIFTRDDDPDTVYGRVRAGADGPVTAVIVVREPGGARRPGALKLLATFVHWASASVGHCRTRELLDAGQQAESARRAEAHGRATARAFAETGSISLLPPEPTADYSRVAARRRAPRPSRAPVFGEPQGPPPRSELSDTDDTERIAPQAIANALAEEYVERRPHPSDSLPFGPAQPPLSPSTTRPTVIDPPGLAAALSARPTADDGPPELGPAAEHLDGDVRAAIERMARRLASAPASASGSSASLDATPVPPIAAFEGLNHGQIDDDMVSADDLPLIGGPGLGVAAEVGRSPVRDRFAHLLADLSDHLDGESDPGR